MIINQIQKTNIIHPEDCLTTMGRLPDACIDLVLTSPPYDDMRTYGGNTFKAFKQVADELLRLLKVGGVIVWVVGDQTIDSNETGTSFRHALYFKEIGLKLFDTMIYQKPPRGAVGNNKTYWQSFEYMFVFSKGAPKTINLLRDRKNKEARHGDNGTKRLHNGALKKIARGGYGPRGRRTNIWTYKIGKGHSTHDAIAYEHPAIFPEKLAQDHILSWTKAGELVYDPFMGSGTTAKMALLNNRQFLGSEIHKPYCELANERLRALSINKQHTNQKMTHPLKYAEAVG